MNFYFNMDNSDDYVASDREKRKWLADKNRISSNKRPPLNREQRIKFLQLVAQMAGRTVFERELSLSPQDVEYYKKEFDIESQDDARKLARQLRAQTSEDKEAQIIEQTKLARQAEAVAQQRLEEIDMNKHEVKERVDANEIRQEDAQRQRDFAEEQSLVLIPEKQWTLPFDESGSEQEQINRFHREIKYRGVGFLFKKYNASLNQIKFEAARLGLKINWDLVRR